MKILVTGAAGFIGSKLAYRLIRDGHEVLVIDNLSTGKKENVPAGARFIESCASSPSILDAISEFRADVIAHCGGQSSGEISEKRPRDDIQWNVVSTLNLLTIAERLGIKKFVCASSMGVYGECKSEVLREEDSGQPISIYGAGKLAAEVYLNTFSKRGMTNISLRMFNVYGPGQNLENQLQGMVSIFLAQLLRSGRVVVRGSLARVRDFVYIDDVVSAWCKAIYTDALASGFYAFNVGSGVGATVGELLENVKRFAGDFEIEVTGCTPKDQFAAVSCNGRIREVLGWEPRIALTEGLERFWEWGRKVP